MTNSCDLVSFTFAVGKLFRKSRRGLPVDVVLAVRDLLQTSGAYMLPKLDLTRSSNVRVARGDIADAMDILTELAGGGAVGAVDCDVA